MRKNILGILCLILLLSYSFGNNINSLSDVFASGKGILDKDRDSLPDHIRISIIVPENASAYEIISASDIAARANLESLVVDMDLVFKSPSVNIENKNSSLPVILSHNLSWIKNTYPYLKKIPDEIPSHQGLVLMTQSDQQPVIVVASGSEENLLKTSRAFFLRWPYLWDVWGRKQGATYHKVEKDLKTYLASQEIDPSEIKITSAYYEFKDKESSYETINRLKFNQGQIKTLNVDLIFENQNHTKKAYKALMNLAVNHKRGLETDILSYPGCAELVLNIQAPTDSFTLELPRVGYPKRILTPSYKSPVRIKVPKSDFDLLNMLSLQGIYSDGNQDRIPDNIHTSLIIPESFGSREITSLASRLTLHTAGASFPLTYLDSEMDEPKQIQNPIIIGKDNTLYKELVKTGKLKEPELKPGTAFLQMIPQAFNQSTAAVLSGSDKKSLGKTMDYLSRTFPYFKEYKKGNPKLHDTYQSLKEFLKGERGSAEAYFLYELKILAKKLDHKKIKSFSADLYLPQKNKEYEEYIDRFIEDRLKVQEVTTESFSQDEPKTIFQKEKSFAWEADEVCRVIQDFLRQYHWNREPLHIHIGVSESPESRDKLKGRIKKILEVKGIQDFQIDVLSSYKQGFFWLKEKVIPFLESKNPHHLVIKFSRFQEDFTQPKRFYTDPYRWLQELYPIDDLISQEAGIPVDQIFFEMKEGHRPVYEITAFDEKNQEVFKDHFSPHVKRASYLKVLPEWGEVVRTTGWLQVKDKRKILLEKPISSDMENFWDFYQNEILPPVYDYILEKTGNKPMFDKQPYFKRLLVELWVSEPDYRLGLDEEIISSLEAIHDEIYFDTLDFLRGITDIQTEEGDLPEDSSRYSAPGNILPIIHPSTEGAQNKVKITFEDQLAKSPIMELSWIDQTGDEQNKKIRFNPIKAQKIILPSLVYDSKKNSIENLFLEAELEKEETYIELIEIVHEFRGLYDRDIVSSPFEFPGLQNITLRIKNKDLTKEERLPVSFQDSKGSPVQNKGLTQDSIVPTKEIISPQMCWEIVDKLSEADQIKSYIGGQSYEGKKIPVIEIHSPMDPYTSIQRLITFKPTLYCNGRQHANEVCSTNYILKFIELLAKKEEYQSFIKKMNFVFHPMENPDGAELAYKLQKITPYHSLHAGRYSTLGIDVGHQVNADHPILPEAKVRKNLTNRWLPDIHLNLHGYPSHEWVQQFSDYAPFLFRDYWIPRGWFVYYRSLSLPIYEKWKEAGETLKDYLIQGLTSSEEIRISNKSLYNRYFRWASRWHPHMNYLELQDGVNIYSKRRSSRESKLTRGRKITFVRETPELMDETARGEWLGFLVKQGLAYIKTHALYLSESTYSISRIEEEVKDKIHIQFIRSRPGEIEN